MDRLVLRFRRTEPGAAHPAPGNLLADCGAEKECASLSQVATVPSAPTEIQTPALFASQLADFFLHVIRLPLSENFVV
jgi:hypothetical protein